MNNAGWDDVMKKTLRGLAGRYRVSSPKSFRLEDWNPEDTAGLDLGKKGAEPLLVRSIERLAELQGRLYADHEWSVLLLRTPRARTVSSSTSFQG